MNKIITIAFAAMIATTFFSSCKKDDNSTPSQVSTLNTNVKSGKWKVTLYNDSGNDETAHYTGYEFQFAAGGTVTATKGGTTITGTWSSGTDDSTLKLILNFSTADPFQELNDDWHVIQQSSTIIKLQDVSGGGGGTDYLTFEKI